MRILSFLRRSLFAIVLVLGVSAAGLAFTYAHTLQRVEAALSESDLYIYTDEPRLALGVLGTIRSDFLVNVFHSLGLVSFVDMDTRLCVAYMKAKEYLEAAGFCSMSAETYLDSAGLVPEFYAWSAVAYVNLVGRGEAGAGAYTKAQEYLMPIRGHPDYSVWARALWERIEIARNLADEDGSGAEDGTAADTGLPNPFALDPESGDDGTGERGTPGR